MVILWAVIGFLSGSIPFSLLLGRIFGGVDIREYGDANPGASNVGRAMGTGWLIVAGLLDGFKAAIPVWVAHFLFGVSGWGLVPVALAPIFGHAYSPWLGFKGGKAVASTFGIWAGLTLGVGPTLMGLLLGVWYMVLDVSGWAVIAMMLCFGAFVLLYYRNPAFMAVWAGNLALFIIKHRDDLRKPITLRPSTVERVQALVNR